MAHRITMVARQLNPTMRIVVRTRYTAEVEQLAEAGADIVIAEELESVVQLFGEVLRDYRIALEEIEAYEELARQNGYAALRTTEVDIDKSIFSCGPGEDCLDSRTVIVREKMPIAEKPLSALKLIEHYGLTLQNVRRGGETLKFMPLDFILQPGDELVLSGSTQAFARNAALFRPIKTNGVNEIREKAEHKLDNSIASTNLPLQRENNGNIKIDVEKAIDFHPQVDESICSHLEQIRTVFPSAKGCEDCLRIGDRWVHLRICLKCGHVGCCDSSKNKHATKHFHDTNHPIIKSLERNEDWVWCYADQTYL
jgi:CPA2 family monovalent cation:H+ antiporter-2